MSDLATLYERNRAFAESFDQGDLPVTPNLSTIILTCVDPRLDPARFAGLELGDAFVLRSAGARVTDAVATEVAILWMLVEMVTGSTPSLELVIIQHSACGMARFADPEVGATAAERMGTNAAAAIYAISDPREALAADVERLRANPIVPRELPVSGHLYDVATGRLATLVEPALLG